MKEWFHKYYYQIEKKETEYIHFYEQYKKEFNQMDLQKDFMKYYAWSDILHEMNSITGNLLQFS
jgi:hypothetical protein